MADVKLKPCPFCGGEAIQIFDVYDGTYVYGCCTIRCVGNAITNKMRLKTDKEAIEAWNRRVNDG